MSNYLVRDGQRIRVAAVRRTHTGQGAPQGGRRHLLSARRAVHAHAALRGRRGRAAGAAERAAAAVAWRRKAGPAAALRHPGRRQDGDGCRSLAAAVRRPGRRHPLGGAARLVAGQPPDHADRPPSSSSRRSAARPTRWRPSPQATSIDDLFLRLEACGALLRIDRERMPSMFHLATLSPGRGGGAAAHPRRRAAGPRARRSMPTRWAGPGPRARRARHAVHRLHRVGGGLRGRSQPVFQGGRIVLQLLRAAAARIQRRADRLCGGALRQRQGQEPPVQPVPFPHTLDDYARAMAANMCNQFQWGQDKALRQWIRDSRLDGFGRCWPASTRPTPESRPSWRASRSRPGGGDGNMPRLLAAAAAH